MRRVLLHLLVAVNRLRAQFLFNAQELVVLGDAVGAAHGTGLDLAGVRRDGDVGDRGVLGFAGAVRGDGRVAGAVGHLDGVERLGERADLVDLDEDRVGGAELDALFEVLDVGDEEVVADELALAADGLGEGHPAVPVVLGHADFYT